MTRFRIALDEIIPTPPYSALTLFLLWSIIVEL